MEEQLLPIVQFGKYKDKSVLDLLADEKYVEWLKQQSWFSNQKKIYNIVVHQTISTTNNSKTPQHNKLQNLFLDKSNQQKLLSNIFKGGLIDRKKLLKDANIIRCFGENIIPESIDKLDETTIKFEDKFNWDLVVYLNDIQRTKITSNLETELFDKIKYKEQYDIKENEEYNNNLLLIDKLIEGRNKLDQEGVQKYQENMREHVDEYEKYENELNIYFQQKPQNEKDIANYEKQKYVYQTKRDKFIKDKTKQICQTLQINYDNFVKWDYNNYGYSSSDRDTKHTTEQNKKLREIVDDKLKPFIKEFEGVNTRPNLVGELNIPTKPSLPQKYDYNKEIDTYKESGEIFDLFEKCRKIIGLDFYSSIHSVDKLNKKKKKNKKKNIKKKKKNLKKNKKKKKIKKIEKS